QVVDVIGAALLRPVARAEVVLAIQRETALVGGQDHELAVLGIGGRADGERRDTTAAAATARTAAYTAFLAAKGAHDVVGRLRRRDRIERRFDGLDAGGVQGGRVHARQVERANLPIVGAGLGFAVADEIRVVNHDLLNDIDVLVAEHSKAAKPGL